MGHVRINSMEKRWARILTSTKVFVTQCLYQKYFEYTININTSMLFDKTYTKNQV